MRRTLTPWCMVILVAALLAACGGEEEARAPARSAGAKPAKAAEALGNPTYRSSRGDTISEGLPLTIFASFAKC